ncbi:MAG: enoyl-CoA hydratase/isomerase family protein, partial [Bacteroidota bacterium]
HLSMNKIKVNYSFDNAVAQIILDDGKGNVLDHIMMQELQELLNSYKSRNELKLITFEGAGKHFSFGASVDEHQKDAAPAMLKGFHQLFYTLREIAIPSMAKISGQCLGGGMELAIMCNFLMTDNSAKFSQPEIVLGVFPPPASIILAEKIGLARAEELIITGKVITADEAKTVGLVNEVFEDKAALETGVNTYIDTYIIPKSATSLRFAVKSSRVKFNHILGNFLPILEQMYVTELMNTHDANEGINAFIEKRKPIWKNN